METYSQTYESMPTLIWRWSNRINKYARYYKMKLIAAMRPNLMISDCVATDSSVPRGRDGRNDGAIKSSLLVSKGRREYVATHIRHQMPTIYERTIKSAEAVCKHSITLFGRGYDLGPNINWHKDIISSYEWPLEFYGDVEILNLTNTADVRFPWEISRFYQAVVLGKAHCLSGNDAYVDEIQRQIHSWSRSNPLYRGINWNCSMEVGIRAINLLWTYAMIVGSKRFSRDFQALFCSLMLAHGNHIFRNMENLSSTNNNHYLANLTALVYIGTVCEAFRKSARWRAYAIRELIKVMDQQVFAEGTSFEGSIPYHRFVTEMFLHATLVATQTLREGADGIGPRYAGTQLFGPVYMDKLEKMCEFIMSYTKPDGLAPQIGDNDNGRLVKLGTEMDNSTNDHRHVLAIAGEFFDRDDFRGAGSGNQEEAIWFMGIKRELPECSAVVVPSRKYEQAGIYIMRNDTDYIIVRCGDLGTGGKGTHTHNDNLSFELCAKGITYIVDPGSFTYAGNASMRNMFRSTSYHNTVVIDGEEQNRFNPGDIFVLFRNSEAHPVLWQTSAEEDIFIGESKQYLRNGGFVMHRREIHFRKASGSWVIKDILTGKGRHELSWNFHAHEDIAIRIETGSFHFVNPDGNVLKMESQGARSCNVEVIEGWYSPCYSLKRPAPILRLVKETLFPFELEFRLSASLSAL